MPVVQYKQLEDELFCNIYYLRHLCDTQKFPDWPIKEPVSHPSSPQEIMYHEFSIFEQASTTYTAPICVHLSFSFRSFHSFSLHSAFPSSSSSSSSSVQVALLKDVLEEWKKEVEKKPPEMSVDQAYDALGLKTGVGG